MREKVAWCLISSKTVILWLVCSKVKEVSIVNFLAPTNVGSVYLWSVDVDFYMLGVSLSAKQFKELAQNIIYRLWEGNRALKIALCLNYHYLVVFDCFLSSFFLHFLTFLWKSRKIHEAKLFYKQEVGRGHKGFVSGMTP